MIIFNLAIVVFWGGRMIGRQENFISPQGKICYLLGTGMVSVIPVVSWHVNFVFFFSSSIIHVRQRSHGAPAGQQTHIDRRPFSASSLFSSQCRCTQLKPFEVMVINTSTYGQSDQILFKIRFTKTG